MSETPILGIFLKFFAYVFASIHQNILKLHICSKLNIIHHLVKRFILEKSGSGYVAGPDPYFWYQFLVIFEVFHIMSVVMQ